MIDLSSLVPILAAFFIVAVSPGPATLAVSSVSASHGRQAGLLFGLGLGTGAEVAFGFGQGSGSTG